LFLGASSIEAQLALAVFSSSEKVPAVSVAVARKGSVRMRTLRGKQKTVRFHLSEALYYRDLCIDDSYSDRGALSKIKGEGAH